MIRNKVILIGRLTRDVELKKTASDISFANFSLAIDKPYNKEKDHPEAVFVNCNVWRNRADFLAKYFGKGDKVAIEGYLDDNVWTDKDGREHKDKIVIVDDIEFVERKSNKSAENDSAKTESSARSDIEEEDEDESEDSLPF